MSGVGRGEVVVRRLGPDDWQTYRAIRLEMLRDSPDAFQTTYEEAAQLDESAWRRRLSAADTLLAEVAGEPVGSVTTWDGPEGEQDPELTNLVAMYVAPTARRRGVGEALVGAALREARVRGRHSIRLEVVGDNVAARSLYERTGFRWTGATRTHARRPDLLDVEMECRLVDARDPGSGPDVGRADGMTH